MLYVPDTPANDPRRASHATNAGLLPFSFFPSLE